MTDPEEEITSHVEAADRWLGVAEDRQDFNDNTSANASRIANTHIELARLKAELHVPVVVAPDPVEPSVSRELPRADRHFIRNDALLRIADWADSASEGATYSYGGLIFEATGDGDSYMRWDR